MSEQNEEDAWHFEKVGLQPLANPARVQVTVTVRPKGETENSNYEADLSAEYAAQLGAALVRAAMATQAASAKPVDITAAAPKREGLN